jgi:hypothetical protein
MKTRITTLIFAVLFTISFSAKAQSQLDLLTPKALYDTIAHMDSVLFNAFNTHTPANLELIKTLFTKDLEFYHDKTGLTDYDFNMGFFTRTLTGNMDLKRELIPGSMEVYPIKGYGAVQIGSHKFCHTENGKPDCGTFKSVTVWKYSEGKWQISRLISYDH